MFVFLFVFLFLTGRIYAACIILKLGPRVASSAGSLDIWGGASWPSEATSDGPRSQVRFRGVQRGYAGFL